MYTIIFLLKKITPKVVVLQSWKKLQVLKEIFLRKKNPSRLFVQIRPTKRCAGIFLNKWVSRYFIFADFFGSEKLFFAIKLLIKLAHRFGDNYLTNHLVKFLQDRIKPWRVGARRVCTGYHFFNENCPVRGFQPLTSRVVFLIGDVNNTH